MNTPTHLKPLTIKQELFVSYLAQGRTVVDSAKLAGYGTNNTWMLTRTKRIQYRLNELRNQIASRATLSTIADLKERKEKLTEILRAALKEGEVNPSHKIAAADILNKIDRLYAQDAPRETETYTTFIFVMPDGTKVRPRELIQGITKIEGVTDASTEDSYTASEGGHVKHAIQRQGEAEGIQQGKDAQVQGG